MESQKTVIELPSPVTGTVRAVNEAIRDDPSVINVDPYGKGWLVEVEIDEPEELGRMMNGETNESFVEEYPGYYFRLAASSLSRFACATRSISRLSRKLCVPRPAETAW